MIVANDSRSGLHNAHTKGLAALLRLKNNPISFLEALRDGKSLGLLRNDFTVCPYLYQCRFILTRDLQKGGQGVLTMPNPKASAKCLDSLLIALARIGDRVKVTSTEGLMDCDEKVWLLQDALKLDQEFAQWDDSQDRTYRPNIIGQVSKTSTISESNVGYWPGKVDIYVDRYIAGIWNVYRGARLYLSELISSLSNGSQNQSMDQKRAQNMDRLVQDVLSSIPYHLTDNLYGFLNQIDNGTPLASVGKAASGLLVMHPLHVISNLSTVDPAVRRYLKKCLVWIAEHMGIRQASLFAKVSDV